MTISREQSYVDDGEIASIIRYSNYIRKDDVFLPLSIDIDRPMEGYTLSMEFRDWKVDPKLPEEAFVLVPPPGAQHVYLGGKEGNGIR